MAIMWWFPILICCDFPESDTKIEGPQTDGPGHNGNFQHVGICITSSHNVKWLINAFSSAATSEYMRLLCSFSNDFPVRTKPYNRSNKFYCSCCKELLIQHRSHNNKVSNNCTLYTPRCTSKIPCSACLSFASHFKGPPGQPHSLKCWQKLKRLRNCNLIRMHTQETSFITSMSLSLL